MAQSKKLVIDMHHHILNEPDYVERMIETMDRLGIDKVCLSGLGTPSNNWLGDTSPDNNDVLRAMEKYPDRIIGMGVIRLGRDPDNIVDQLHGQGFTGLKTTRTLKNYDDPSFDPIYRRAEELRMPFLFHTGFIVKAKYDKEDNVSSDRMRPVLLDRVARSFPELPIFIAHLGMPWHEEAAMMARFNPNVYIDFTGSPQGWRNRKPPHFFQELFYWENAFEKVVFGTDTHWRDVEDSLIDHRRIFTLNNVPQATQDKIFGSTVAELFKL
jgi:hypothetical protein